MGVPKISFTYKTAAETVAQRLKDGIVGIIVKDSSVTAGLYTVAEEADIPGNMSATNSAYILQALKGSRDKAPSKAIVSVIGEEADVADDGATSFAATDVDYIVGPPDMQSEDAVKIKTWLTKARQGTFIGKLVAADYAADDMAVVNFCATGITTTEAEYSGAGYCARIAGILASTDLAASATYAPLDEVVAVDAVADPDAAVDAGKLILLHDGIKAKIARAVNSLVTIPSGTSSAMKKIKAVEAVDLIRSYALRLVQDTYMGVRTNNYDNKLTLVSDLNEYMAELVLDGVIAENSYSVDIDLAAQRAWLKEHGVDVSEMTAEEILRANTGSAIFIAMSGELQDAMEDFAITLTMGGAA